jgi:hypothetical protein
MLRHILKKNKVVVQYAGVVEKNTLLHWMLISLKWMSH